MKAISTPRSEVLENGVWVATEALPHIRSASLSIYLDTGSRDEAEAQNGISHFFEHMVFKGTEKLGPLDIVKRFEATGGQVNAYTSKEQTCFYGKVVDTEIEGAFEVLLDMVLGGKFDPTDIAKEKEVVLEEIRGTQDSADDLAYDLFSHATFGTHALGRPIAGIEKTVRSLDRKRLIAHREGAAKKWPMAIIAVGNVDHDSIVSQVRRRFQLGRKKNAQPRVAIARKQGVFQAGHASKQKEVQQATIILGGLGYAWHSPLRVPLFLLHSVLGDGMSAKLFQNLRENYGLVYSIYSNPEFLTCEGLFTIGFATEPKNLAKAVKEIGKELAAIRNKGLTKNELEFAKKSMSGAILLGLESTSSRMATIARRLLGGNPTETIEQIIARVNAVTQKDVLQCAQEVLRLDQWASAAVYPKGFKADLATLLAKA